MSEKRMRKREIIKLGGSLIEIGRDIIQVLRVYAEKKDITILLIPGGGPFAEVVRTVSVEGSLTEEAALGGWISNRRSSALDGGLCNAPVRAFFGKR